MDIQEKQFLLQPGVRIKPKVERHNIENVLWDFYGLKCVEISELNGYDDNNYHVIVDGAINNIYVKKINEEGYVLKVVNSLDSQKPEYFKAQTELCLHLEERGFCCPKCVQTKNGDYLTRTNFPTGSHIVRLLEFIPGKILHQVASTNCLFYECGKFVAQLDQALKTFHHPVYETHASLWHLQCVPQLSRFLYAIQDPLRLKIVKDVVNEFTESVLTRAPRLEKGILHGDFNEQNILVKGQDGNYHVKGILDFGDSQMNCYLYELAITMAYMMIQGRSIEVGGHVLKGYCSVRPLPEIEKNLLRVCIAGRLCQSLVMGAYSSLQDPGNEYVLVTAEPGWVLLQEIWGLPQDKLWQRWNNAIKST